MLFIINITQTTVLAYARPWLTQFLCKNLPHDTIMIANGSPRDLFMQHYVHAKKQYLQKTYARSVFNMEFTQPDATPCFPFATD